MPEIKYEITQSIACLSEDKNGWTKELNLVSWNGNTPKYDIRSWSADHSKMGKGITSSSGASLIWPKGKNPGINMKLLFS